ncbi:Acetoacetate metabolism regulatory protein AtoC [Nitrospira sp. KM1]|uniref:sigma-54-dependent transcriptional regulator n=1 Tax=Nitrospira sp. KM1 TaxID=1936990 RepID=UPI0013A745B4|nr:sigma-54 dependent transcriptional regulator [Nitrospira sp. KM1]BCA54532.1 Acetoacetate metabolism regulatory protein AtoC [Nitrospira sp. KM1]
MALSDTHILVVDDDEENNALLAEALSQRGYRTTMASNGHEACQKAKQERFSLIVSDIQMGALSGIELLKWLRTNSPETPVILLTAFGCVEIAINAMKHGAFDYLTKPINLEELFLIVTRALEHERLVRENNTRKTALSPSLNVSQRVQFGSIVAQSRSMVEIFKTIGKAAPTRASLLIYGETGTGKELIARSLHENSARFKMPFIALNCAAIPDNLLESELFGHVKGAFTNALHMRRGLLEESSGGTLFLDEISDLSLASQAKLLRVLQEGEIKRLGSNFNIKVDLRLVSASQLNLADLVKQGRFREDLFYRLKTITVTVPPLRERIDDIPLLADLFLARYGSAKNITGYTPSALLRLQQYHWPGNVRELEHVVERVVTLAPGPIISEEDLPVELHDSVTQMKSIEHQRPVAFARRKAAHITRDELLDTLKKTFGNKAHASEVLGISRWALKRLLEKHALEERTSWK